jgi:hypothetical protein
MWLRQPHILCHLLHTTHLELVILFVSGSQTWSKKFCSDYHCNAHLCIFQRNPTLFFQRQCPKWQLGGFPGLMCRRSSNTFMQLKALHAVTAPATLLLWYLQYTVDMHGFNHCMFKWGQWTNRWSITSGAIIIVIISFFFKQSSWEKHISVNLQFWSC